MRYYLSAGMDRIGAEVDAGAGDGNSSESMWSPDRLELG
jgi:hypothetical protein